MLFRSDLSRNLKYTKEVCESQNRQLKDNTFGALTRTIIHRPPKKYRRNRLLLNSNNFEIGDFNQTFFSGLDNTFADPSVNAITFVLFFIPGIREGLMHHLCTQEHCVSCELGFLFHYLEVEEGTTVPNTSLLRTVMNTPGYDDQ